MIKATGRLTFPALGKALDRVTSPAPTRPPLWRLMIDCRKLRFPRRGHDASVQLFVCSHDFYDRVLRGSSREINSSEVRLLEHLMFPQGVSVQKPLGHYLRFPCNSSSDPVGYFGSKDRRYDSPLTAPARGIRALLRVIAPGYSF